MSHLTASQCHYYLERLNLSLQDTLRRPDSYCCQCSQSAETVQVPLLARMNQGDDFALLELLSYYRCLDDWTNEVFTQPEWRSFIRADLNNRLMKMPAGNFSNQLRAQFTQSSIGFFKHKIAQIMDEYISPAETNDTFVQFQ
jgi:hypothetical protein